MGRQHDSLVSFMISRADWVNALFGAFQNYHLHVDGFERIVQTLKTLSDEMETLRKGAELQLTFPKHDVPQCFWVRWARLRAEIDQQCKLLESHPPLPAHAPFLFDMICLQVGRLTLCASDSKGEIDTYAMRKEELIIEKTAALTEPYDKVDATIKLQLAMLHDVWARHNVPIDNCKCYQCQARRTEIFRRQVVSALSFASP